MKQPILQVSGLQSGYGETTVLWDIDLTVNKGDVVAVVGANGAGKTTLLRALSGLIPITRGEVRLNGRPVGDVGPHQMVRLGMAHVPEGRQLFAGLSVRDNLLMGAYSRTDSHGVRADLDETLELFPELKPLLSRQAGLLSGGQQQMVAIGRGLMSKPSLLMVDEFSLGLAPVVVDRITELIVRISQERGITIVVVEQDVHRALDAATWGFVIDNGRVVKSGAAAALRDDEELRQIYMGI